ncbi:hypothetical protein H2199_005767 [Coniosporium tulheliwenetii]|uniref:Uncharacterized protein n=1 Tax=Coniosporium tulheliwenetii TaxID=3383036 RepID=A0ACC2Z130_9PEZI|nr:hypothetical protein H2199_005767 [Cladosporium sp. JES 115]
MPAVTPSPPQARKPPRPKSLVGVQYATNPYRHMPPPSPQAGGPAPKVATPRITQGSDAGTTISVASDKQRTTHACTKCRQRKVRCSGEKPRCKHCVDFDLDCRYADEKRDRFNKDHEELRNRYTDLKDFLKDLSLRATPKDQQNIRNFLEQRFRAATESPPKDNKEHGEDLITAEVGSQEETDRLDEDLNRTKESRATGFVGKNSEVQWLRRLKIQTDQPSDQGSDSRANNPYGPPGKSAEAAGQRLQQSDKRWGSGNHSESNELISGSTYHMDMEEIILMDHIDPYEMPLEDTGRKLLDLYLTTVQAAFPIIQKDYFTKQLLQYYDRMARGKPARPYFRWLGIVNLIFAIGAKLSHLVKAEWRGDDRDHLIYFTRARMLAFNGEAIIAHPELQHVQFVGLLAFYFLTISHMSRAWTLCGLAARDAIALGLHIRNEDPNIDHFKRETRIRMWWSLYTLDRLVTVISGRPSAVRDDECSVPFPLPIKEDHLATFFAETPTSDPPRSHGLEDLRRKSSDAEAVPPRLYYITGGPQAVRVITDHFLKSHVELAVITGKLITELYTASSGERSWTQAQDKIRNLGKEIDYWREKAFPKQFNFSGPLSADIPFLRERLTLGFFYYSAKMLAGRPCLYSINDRIEHQTMQSKEFNIDEARACVNAARAMVDLLPDKPDPVFLYKNGPWWCQVHLLMQASSILMLELSFSCEHMRHEKRQIVDSLKKLVRWLRRMGEDNNAADRACDHIVRLLEKVAPKIDVDVSDIVSPPSAPAMPIAQVFFGPTNPFQPPFTDQPQDMQGMMGLAHFDHGFQPQYQTNVQQPSTTYQPLYDGNMQAAYDSFAF